MTADTTLRGGVFKITRILLPLLLLLIAVAPEPAHGQTSPPAAPTGLTTPILSHDSVTLSWDDPQDSSIEGYQILRRDIVNQPPGTFGTVENDTDSRSTTYTDGTVEPDTRYAYRIKARNTTGLSGQSNYVNVTTLEAPTEPSSPPVVAPQQSESSDATLSALTVDGTSVPGFSGTTTSYQYGVAHSVSQVTVAATTTDAAATVAYSGTDADSGTDGHQLALSAGRNAITVTMTAQDGNTTKHYTVSVNRGVNTAYGWKASDDFDTLDAAGNEDPYGLWSDGTTMWVADGADAKLYAYNLSTKARDSSKDFGTLDAAGNDLPVGIWSNGATMWVADVSDVKLYAYNLSTKARDSSKDFTTLNAAGNNDPSVIWSDGTTMWVADSNDDKLYAYSTSTKARDSSKDFDTLHAALNWSPWGLWSDGTTMWVDDLVDKKIYAYSMSTKARDSSKDFETLRAAGNETPRGIWSDGTTMWVSDRANDKLYAYNMELPLPSDDAGLSALTVDGTSIPGFNADRASYQYGVAHSVSQVTIGATTTHSAATVAYSGTDADSGTDGHQLALSAGRNAITVTVTAEDGNTTAEYTVSVNRGVNTVYGWKAVTDFDTLKAAGNDGPSGLWSNGTTMWVVDFMDDKIYAYNLSTKARDSGRDFDTLASADNEDPGGIWSNGTTMWVADYRDDKIYAYNLSTKARDSGKDFDTLDSAGNEDPGDIWSNGTTMWVVDSIDSKIYAYNLSTKARDSGRDFDTLASAGNDHPSGIWSDGTTMWATDFTDKNIYAYSMSTKARDSAKDFDTLNAAGNENASDIWSEGATMWVSDATDDKIYSYNITPPQTDVATLSALTVNGTSVPGFNADRASYQYGVAHSVSQVTIVATTTRSGATVAYSTTDADSGTDGHQLALSAGRNAITVTVTAEDGNTTGEYTVSVNRGVNTAYGWRAVADFDTLIAAGNDHPSGIWSDGTTMWVGDFGDATIYAYNPSTKARDSVKDFNTLAAAGNHYPSGIWSDGTTMWVLDTTDKKIYAYSMSTKARDSAKDFDTLAAGNNLPTGIWSDGTTMWVADFFNATIFAYNLSTKARDSGKDFDTLFAAGNENPRVLWSDGTTMWVADVRDSKLYAYNLSTKARATRPGTSTRWGPQETTFPPASGRTTPPCG